MLLKNNHTKRTTFTYLDLLGTDEDALSKAFAFLLAHDKDCYFRFLKFLEVKNRNTNKNYFNASVEIQKHREEGRTDIELKHVGKYHIIIECKIKKGKALKQRTQYLTAFSDTYEETFLCFLTQERDTSKQIPNDTIVKNIDWLDIIELYNKKQFFHKSIVSDFLKFTTKNYRMREIKEILIQNLQDETEIERFEKYGVYRRFQIYGVPLYFAPYFTRNSGRHEGITKLSKILGTISIKPSEIDNFRSDLERFSPDHTQVNYWIKGVKLKGRFDTKENLEKVHTYYFLENPLTFPKALKKDKGIKKGRGKNWIAAMIPQNRCVTFTEFIKHIPELMK